MTMTPHTTIIESSDAWQLLRGRSIGRLAVSLDDRPDIFPVNFLADGADLLVRTAHGTKTARIAENTHVAFEVDEVTSEHAWSVVVKGTARVITEQSAIDLAERSPLWAWSPEPKHVFLRISVAEVTGRRFQRH